MGTRLEHVIARNVAELRNKRGTTQPQLAEMMRTVGFGWQSNRVAQIETLRRPVSLLEVVGLSRVFGVTVSRLLAGDDEIDLPSGITMPLADVRGALLTDYEGELVSAVREMAGRHATARDELRKVAKGLGLEVNDLEALAYRLWGRSFLDERERRLGDVLGLSKRSAQTKRGHVTRGLLADANAYLGQGQQRVDRLNEVRAAEFGRLVTPPDGQS